MLLLFYVGWYVLILIVGGRFAGGDIAEMEYFHRSTENEFRFLETATAPTLPAHMTPVYDLEDVLRARTPNHDFRSLWGN
jgi:hypothetical protein